MPGISIMAVLTVGLTAILCITVLDHLTGRDRRYLWLVLAGLPLSFLVNRLVKIPAITSLAAWTGIPLRLDPGSPWWFIAAIWLNAPLFEEGIKAVPMLVPASRVFVRDASQTIRAGLALGMGFGLGEAVYLAYGIAQSPEFNQLPWYTFTGFASERLIVTFAHGWMTSIAVLGIRSGGRKALAGFLTAVGLHALINLGPILLALKWIPAAVSSLESYAAILLAFLIFQRHERVAAKSSGREPKEVVYFER